MFPSRSLMSFKLVVRARIVVAGVDTFLRYAAALGLAGPPALVAAQTSAGK